MRRVWIVALVVGCGGAGASSGSGVSGGPPWMHAEDDPLAARMREIARRMGEAGLEAGEPSGKGFLTARAEATEPLEVPAGRCATIVAITARGIRDLDATLYAPTGDVLAEDVEPDAHPTIQVCAGEAPRRLYYALVAYDGAGTFAYVSFLGDRSSLDRAAEVVGGQPGVVSDDDQGSEEDVRLREITAGVRRRGFRPEGTPMSVPIAEGQRVRVPLHTEPARCYTVVSLAGPNVRDLNLLVVDELGVEVARDVSSSKDATVQLCADREADFAAEVHAAGGAGEARVAIFAGAEREVGSTSGLWLGERSAGARSPLPLEDAVRADLDGARAVGWADPRRTAAGSLVGGQAVAHALALAANRCTLLVATGGRGVGRLHLRVVDENGRALAVRGGHAPSATARVCTEESTRVSAQVVARRGEGDYALHVLEKPLETDLSDVSAEDRGAVLDAIDDAGARGFTLRSRERQSGAVREAPVDTTSGCALVTAVAPRGVVVLRVTRHGSLVASREGPSPSSLVCPGEGRARATVSVTAPREGPLYLLTFARAP
jgi:hypothetical protein